MTRLSETLAHLEKSTSTHKQTITEILEKMLTELEKNLQSRFRNVLNTLQEDTNTQLQKFQFEQSQVLNETMLSLKKSLEATRFHQKEAQRLLMRRWWVPTLTGFTVSLALFLGVWGGSKTMVSLLSHQGSVYAENQREIKWQERTLDLMKTGTWGVRFQEGQEGKFIIIPQGYQAEYTCGGKPCVKVGKY